LLERAGALLEQLRFSSTPVVVTNSRILGLHGTILLPALEKKFGPSPVIVVGDGERHKNLAALSRVYDGLFRAHADRRSWIIAFGGGVVGDLAGFAAATFMRGIPYVHIPTTLLAQVDSSIGGKVGVNLELGKNLVGAFHQPRAVLSDTATLRTLASRELASGLYEVIKCAAIKSESLFSYLESQLPSILACKRQALEHVILEASRIKAEVVSSDELENRQRMILNFGHTVGHALEAATDYRRFKHGEAVAWGMIAAVGFGEAIGITATEVVSRIVRLIHRVTRLPSLNGLSLTALRAAMGRDKKFQSGRIRMVLLRRLGEAEIRDDIDPARLRSYLKKFLAHPGQF
jgi:3-dehydroquinate synthase